MNYKLLHKEGSSLLVAILVMGILITLTLGLSDLVIREIRQTGDVVAAGQAYFGAEAAAENALLDLTQHLPGYQTANEDGDDWVSYKATDGHLEYRYRIRNQGDAYPYFDDDEPVLLDPNAPTTKQFIYENDREKTFNILPLHQTVTIPLFVQNPDGTEQKVEKFLVEYYVKFTKDSAAEEFRNIALEKFDILRWRIFGNPEKGLGDEGKTEAISDFYPAVTNADADNPVCIGTDSNIDTTGVACKLPIIQYVSQSNTIQDDNKQYLWSAARECYLNDAGSLVAGGDPTQGNKIKTADEGGCSMATFIQNHQRNYLTLTNIVNPDIIDLPEREDRQAKANIYYRVIALTGQNQPKLPREFAHINAHGYAQSGKVQQSIDVKYGLRSFLPVFNFSLYRVDSTKPQVEVLPDVLQFFNL